ncbi:LysR family transcriptional regulator, partial [Streptomyces sp. SID1034]
MDPHLLRSFVAVVERGSFSAAAQALGYTQSAVSQHIAALEADLGTPLLRRRPVGPTEAGERLMEHARPLLLRLEAARADLARLTRVRPARLT